MPKTILTFFETRCSDIYQAHQLKVSFLSYRQSALLLIADRIYKMKYTSAGGSYIYAPGEQEHILSAIQTAVGRYHMHVDTAVASTVFNCRLYTVSQKKHPQHFQLYLENQLTNFNNFWHKYF